MTTTIDSARQAVLRRLPRRGPVAPIFPFATTIRRRIHDHVLHASSEHQEPTP